MGKNSERDFGACKSGQAHACFLKLCYWAMAFLQSRFSCTHLLGILWPSICCLHNHRSSCGPTSVPMQKKKASATPFPHRQASHGRSGVLHTPYTSEEDVVLHAY